MKDCAKTRVVGGYPLTEGVGGFAGDRTVTEERSNGTFRRPGTLLRLHLPINRLDNLELRFRNTVIFYE